RFDGKKWRRGVVFISEIVPLPAISFIANSFYGEKYKTLPMRATRVLDQDILSLQYSWRFRGSWQCMEVSASTTLKPLESVPGADFITNHFWGYSRRSSTLTHEYHVSHPSWNLYPVVSAAVKCDFKNLYGDSFAFLKTQEPASIFLAQGSPVKIFHKSLIRSVAG
ncbi:MAG: DUF2071 domain-containing protein, partial [Ferruginibacter sp.]